LLPKLLINDENGQGRCLVDHKNHHLNCGALLQHVTAQIMEQQGSQNIENQSATGQ
jgi:hypothetical protein